jgi:hypothetical protein
MRLAFVAALALLLGACATTSTPYQPRDAQGYGFTEQPLEANRTRITFSGNGLTERETVETYLLYRAAELTLQQGFDYFVTANRATDARRRTYRDRDPFYPRFAPVMWYRVPHRGWVAFYDPFYDPFYRGSYDTYEVTRFQAVAEISMFKGAKPADNADAYDAHEVEANLRAQVVRPAPAAAP